MVIIGKAFLAIYGLTAILLAKWAAHRAEVAWSKLLGRPANYETLYVVAFRGAGILFIIVALFAF